MHHHLAALVFALSCVGLLCPAPVSARDLKTMHFENNLPRPAGVGISGVQPGQVVLYCTDSVACKGLRDHLRKTRIAFLDKDPENDPLAGAEFDALGGQGVPLVVFNQRLMHGYYPSSFNQLYARYHSAMPSATVPVSGAAAASPKTGEHAEAVAPVSAATPRGLPGADLLYRMQSREVEEVAPAALAAYVQANPNVMVQLTSYDPGCRYCVESYPAFNAAARAHAERLRFVRVHWSPWRAIPQELGKLGGVPEHLAFKDGQLVGRLQGTLMGKSLDMSRLIEIVASRTPDPGRLNSASSIEELDADALGEHVTRHPLVVVQFTSPDPNCGPCAASYVAFDEVAAAHRGPLQFVRVQWMPWGSFPAAVTAQYKLRMVPAILAFKDGQVVDRIAGAPDRNKLAGWLNRQAGRGP